MKARFETPSGRYQCVLEGDHGRFRLTLNFDRGLIPGLTSKIESLCRIRDEGFRTEGGKTTYYLAISKDELQNFITEMPKIMAEHLC